jgi:hypothetical protein
MPFETSATMPATRVRQAIADAASRTGVDFDYLYNQARIESSLDPAAKAKTSSASGLFQFTQQTWLQTLKSHGGEHGLQWAADAIARRGAGFSVADPQQRAAIDALRFDPAASSAMAAEFAADNAAHLTNTLGRMPDPVDLYLAHFLGPGGAATFLKAHEADPSAAAAPLLPAAAAANRNIFFTPQGRARTTGEIRASFAAKLGDSAPPAAAPRSDAPPRWAAVRRDAEISAPKRSTDLASFEPMPPGLSLDFAARAYRRLSGMGA